MELYKPTKYDRMLARLLLKVLVAVVLILAISVNWPMFFGFFIFSFFIGGLGYAAFMPTRE